MAKIADLVNQAKDSLNTSAEVVKTAYEQGVADSDRVVKVANYAGDIMGNSAFLAFHDSLAESLGFDPEGMAKTASVAEMITASIIGSFEKVAEAYSSQTGGENLETTQLAAVDQLCEAGKSHALLAVQSAQDALASVSQGDPNTAAQSMRTAGQNISLAQEAASVVQDPELQAQVAEASAVVANAASAMQQQA